MDFILLSGFYLLSVVMVLYLIYRAYTAQAFSMHLLFSLVYFVTFYLGYPLSVALKFGFDISLQPAPILFSVLFSATAGYLIYYLIYQLPWLRNVRATVTQTGTDFQRYSQTSARLTALLLLAVAFGTVGYFFLQNGLLLFKLEKYSQIFSQDVQGVALKRFFYFFIPALLIIFFLSQSKKAWIAFLICGVAFGTLTYLLVGGTRANIAIAFSLFFFLGIYKKYISIFWLGIAGVIAIVAMFLLALARYGLEVNGSEAVFTFLYLTRDTFSPWENVALLFANDVEHQGLMPIVRDFYVFIPKAWWSARPDLILNSANYFTWEVLNYHAGLAISPTLIGSFYIMGGFPMVGLGMAFVGLMIKGVDALFDYAKYHPNRSTSAVLQAFCFANTFNVIVLAREGADAFFSRFVFFAVIFFACWALAQLITTAFEKLGFTKVVQKEN